MAGPEREVAELEQSLRHCRRELAAVREEQEEWYERLAPLEHAAARLRELTSILDEHLSSRERATGGLRGWVKRRVVRSAVAPEELDDLAKLHASPLFDGAWYLQQYPEVVRTGLSPALHYLRHGAGQRKDPGPNFSTREYLDRSGPLPDGANPLLHYEAHVPGVAS